MKAPGTEPGSLQAATCSPSVPGSPADFRDEKGIILPPPRGKKRRERREGKKHRQVLLTTLERIYFLSLPPFPLCNVSIFKELEERYKMIASEIQPFFVA